MAGRRFTRGQTQLLYRYLPDAVFQHDDYGLCIVDQVTMDIAEMVNKSALFDTLCYALSQWERESFREKFPDPRDEKKRKLYRIGQPKEVLFTPFPRVMECRKCGHVVDFDRLNRRGLRPGVCPRPECGGQLMQLQYVEAHNCGRMQQMYVPPPSAGCPQHKTQYLRFFDPGRTQSARWVCGVCGRELQKARMTPCQCEYTRALQELGRSPYERFMRLYPASEPGLYIPHVVAFINFQEEQEHLLMEAREALPLLLARAWGVLDQRVLEVVEERARWGGGGDGIPVDMKEMYEALAGSNPDHPLVKKYKEKMANPPGQSVIDTVKGLVGDVLAMNDAPARKLVEHVALRDDLSLTQVQTVAERMRELGEVGQAEEFMRDARRGFKRLGLKDVSVVNDFPVALSALGYTRVTKNPARSVFNPFRPDEEGKIPLFVIPTETEGLWFELDAERVATWLCLNGIIRGTTPSGKAESWAWLHRVVLREILYSPVPESSAASAVFMLVHTMSHIFLQRIEWSGFASSSIGEYLMAGTLSFVLYANRFAQSKIGGLTTLYEQRLPLWLDDALQAGRSCIYDPLCAEDGGSCAGCLHREHNCPVFNREMSRAILYGGILPEEGINTKREIKKGYWDL